MKLKISEPIIVSRGPDSRTTGWGPYQFPSLTLLPDGRILCSHSVGADHCSEYGKKVTGNCHISEDGGKTWRKRLLSDREKGPLMSNGKEYFCADMHNAFVPSWLEKYTPLW